MFINGNILQLDLLKNIFQLIIDYFDNLLTIVNKWYHIRHEPTRDFQNATFCQTTEQ